LTEPREIGVYVHWPYCAKVCPYCDFNVVRDRGRRGEKKRLAEAILKDLRAQAAEAGPRRLVSIFLGGGTPSTMEPAWAADIIAEARRLFGAGPAVEVTLEANPTDAEARRFADFAQAGVTRLSLGVQSFDDAALVFLGRNHDAAQARRAAKTAANSFPRLSLDLIYALPDQSVSAWREALTRAAGTGCEHISAYQLTIEDGTAFDRAVRRGRWAPSDEATAASLYDATDETLAAAGFEIYEISNHAKGEAARSRHNLIYWRGEDYLGVGPGAHGRLTVGGRRWATRAADRIAGYVAAVEACGSGLAERLQLSVREVALERLLMGLRTIEGVALAELEPLGLEVGALGELQNAGLLLVVGGRLFATRRGRPVLDRLTVELAQSARAG
jgi:putative oxygen-independent coproporphyrinogen III oxidase